MKRKSRNRHAAPAAATAVKPQGRSQVSTATVSPTQEAEAEGQRIENPRSQGAQEKIHVPEEIKGLVAEVRLAPEMSAALSMNGMMGDCLIEAGIDATTVSQMLGDQGAAVVGGDLAQAQRSLASQAATLERMFHHLFRTATVAEKHSTDLYERYMRLALRAQSQAVRTLQVMGRLCPQPARQAQAASPPPQKTVPKPVAAKTTEVVRTNTTPSSTPNLMLNPMPADGWRTPARGGALWGGGLSAPKP